MAYKLTQGKSNLNSERKKQSERRNALLSYLPVHHP
jgi:hypothetical protein